LFCFVWFNLDFRMFLNLEASAFSFRQYLVLWIVPDGFQPRPRPPIAFLNLHSRSQIRSLTTSNRCLRFYPATSAHQYCRNSVHLLMHVVASLTAPFRPTQPKLSHTKPHQPIKPHRFTTRSKPCHPSQNPDMAFVRDIPDPTNQQEQEAPPKLSHSSQGNCVRTL
jgi:hypothetical protein